MPQDCLSRFTDSPTKLSSWFRQPRELERFEAAVDSDWAEQLERAIAVRQITDRGFVLD